MVPKEIAFSVFKYHYVKNKRPLYGGQYKTKI